MNFELWGGWGSNPRPADYENAGPLPRLAYQRLCRSNRVSTPPVRPFRRIPIATVIASRSDDGSAGAMRHACRSYTSAKHPVTHRDQISEVCGTSRPHLIHLCVLSRDHSPSCRSRRAAPTNLTTMMIADHIARRAYATADPHAAAHPSRLLAVVPAAPGCSAAPSPDGSRYGLGSAVKMSMLMVALPVQRRSDALPLPDPARLRERLLRWVRLSSVAAL
jgi:hypothetical protein